jgi:hypothetical protein
MTSTTGFSSQIINYGVYFPIQIWKSRDGKKIRFQQPKIFREEQAYEFFEHFIDSEKDVSVNDYVRVKEKYFLERVIWVINPRYAMHATRGFTWLYIFNESKYPYNSVGIFSILNVPVKISLDTLYNGISFVAYQYSIPSTSLICFVRNRFRKIKNVIIVNESVLESDSETETEDYKQYPNFLPFEQNRNVPFYKIKIPDRYVFAYIFTEKPAKLYWRPNSENICIPSDNLENGYHTLMECVYNNVDKLAIRDVYMHSNNESIKTLLEPPPPRSRTPLIFLILVLSTILFMILLAVVVVMTGTTKPVL